MLRGKMLQEQKQKSKIPYFFFAFFAVILVVNIFFIYISKKTWRGVITEDSYQKGLHYNDAIKAVNEQKKLGWKMKINYSSSGKNSGSVKIDLEDKNSEKITDAKLYVNFKRPTQEGFDFTKSLEFDGKEYRAEIVFPLAGQWDFEVVATKNYETFQTVKRYIIQ
jgi:nitrogen fixation protein FixH